MSNFVSFTSNNPKVICMGTQQFLEDLVLYICKGYKPLSSCENVYLQRFSFTPKPLCIISFLIFFYGRSVANHGEKDHGPDLPNLVLAIVASTSFYLWIFHGGVDTFALVINFLSGVGD